MEPLKAWLRQLLARKAISQEQSCQTVRLFTMLIARYGECLPPLRGYCLAIADNAICLEWDSFTVRIRQHDFCMQTITSSASRFVNHTTYETLFGK